MKIKKTLACLMTATILLTGCGSEEVKHDTKREINLGYYN